MCSRFNTNICIYQEFLPFSFISLCLSWSDAPCSELQGMLSGLLPDSQISASSMRDIHGSMGAARLVASRSGWFPNPTQPIAGEEWLQVRHHLVRSCYDWLLPAGGSSTGTKKKKQHESIATAFISISPGATLNPSYFQATPGSSSSAMIDWSNMKQGILEQTSRS